LWVDIFDPHEPWDPPRQYLAPGEQELPWILYPRFGEADRYSPEELEAIRALYRGEVRMADHWVGRLLKHLDDSGLREDTCVVFLSDHGMFLGEHNLLGKSSKIGSDLRGWPPYVEVSRIPMMFRVPGLEPGRREALVHPGDVTTTLLELAGVPRPERMRTPSLAPVLRGDMPGRRPVAVSSWSLRGARTTRPSVVRDAEWSLVFWRTGVPPELYHRPTDPGETRNVLRGNEREARRLHREYVRFLQESDTPAKNYWPRRWLVSWGESGAWQGATQARGAETRA
ncbi:MAG TPA: sulfatase-like hydrolase/transferase, partial [Armatimonadota bacterium]|nr:sulfatase-like hydrolase/transferase [Armatimonadota bacterium]